MSIEVMKQALEALKGGTGNTRSWHLAMEDAIEALRTAIQQATQPAEVTDQLIEAEFQQCGGKWNGDQWIIEDADLHPFARAILALRPVQVPMTDEQIRSMCKQGWVFETVKQWVSVIEAHHGITAKDKKEAP